MTNETNEINALADLINCVLACNEKATADDIAKFLVACGYRHKHGYMKIEEATEYGRKTFKSGADMLLDEIRRFCSTNHLDGQITICDIEAIKEKMIEGANAK